MTPRELLERWYLTIRRTELEHALAARFYEKMNWKLGVPVVILTAIVGASVFATLEKTDLLWLKVATGLLSVLAVVLSSLQTFLGFGERAAAHKAAADRFGQLAREAQQGIVIGVPDTQMQVFLKDLRESWDAITQAAPSLRNSTIIALTHDQESV